MLVKRAHGSPREAVDGEIRKYRSYEIAVHVLTNVKGRTQRPNSITRGKGAIRTTIVKRRLE